jgi:hypothetical protein
MLVREFILEMNYHADLGRRARHVTANAPRLGGPEDNIFVSLFDSLILKGDFYSKNTSSTVENRVRK